MRTILILLIFSQLLLSNCKTDNSIIAPTIGSQVNTELPIISIKTENNTLINSKDEYVEASMSFRGGELFDSFTKDIQIRGRGNSTWVFPKKPYQIRFEKKTSLMGMPKDKRWVLLANYSDKTMLRNKLAFELGKLSNLDWTPESYFADVFVNNDFQGTYQITQKVEESSNRVNIGNDGFLLEVEQQSRLEDDDIVVRTDSLIINIKDPEIASSDEQYVYIYHFINDVEDVLYDDTFSDPENGYAKFLDVESFVDWYLINEISKNNDAIFLSSVFMNHVPGGKLKMGPIWDFDRAFGNNTYNSNESPEGFWVKDSKWISRLFEDPTFVEKVKERFEYFNSNKDFIYAQIDLFSSQLDKAQLENDEKWKTLGRRVEPNHVWFDTYEEEVEYLKEWIDLRFDWLEVALDEL